MKKAFDQTVRDIKREVNKKVLKVPGIEQKVLDATSNEPWGPHGSLLADIAQASRNYHEYQMIMTVVWKRLNDTGKNWRHVYKGLTVLEYLVAHGSERVIDEIREHAYQISTLSNFQYIDSSGRDQGSNVRKKSQSLVILVNDKERIQEVRQKAAANRDKFRSTAAGGMYRPGSYGDRYDDDRYEGRYGSRDDDRNGYGREREWGYRDDRYGRYGDSYGRDVDRYSRDSDERGGRDGYRDDDYRGRSRSIDDYSHQYSSRSKSSDRERDRTYEDDVQYSSSSAGRKLERKFSEQNLGPPSYEEAVVEARSPVHSERDGEASAASAPQTSVPPLTSSPSQATPAFGTSAAPAPAPAPAAARAPSPVSASASAPVNKEVDGFDEFDPRNSSLAVPTTSNGAEMDLFGSLSDSFSSNPLAIMPVTSAVPSSDANASASFSSDQPFEDPFGDGPFRALPSADGVPAPPENIAQPFQPSAELPQPVAHNLSTVNHGNAFPDMTYAPSNNLSAPLPSTNAQFSPQELSISNQNTDILADILPPPGPSHTGFQIQASQPAPASGFTAEIGQAVTMTGFPAQSFQPGAPSGFPAQTGQTQLPTGFSTQASQPTLQTGFVAQTDQPVPLSGFPAQAGQPASQTGFPGQISSVSQMGFPASSAQPVQPTANFYGNFLQQPGPTSPVVTGPVTQYNISNVPTAPAVTQMALPIPGGLATQHSNGVLGNSLQQALPTSTMTSQPIPPPSTGSLAMVPQPAKAKFEPKSAIWADTLNRGLVNLNISGPKINPLSDIGIDFDAINRKEKRMEKPTTATVTSTVTMGKAMGSGSGMGRAGASALRPPPSPMMGSGMGMGTGGVPSPGMGMGGYGGMNQPMGMGMNMPMNMGMGMGQGAQIQQSGFIQGPVMPGGYNPMMGRGGYAPQHPYGSGYQ